MRKLKTLLTLGLFSLTLTSCSLFGLSTSSDTSSSSSTTSSSDASSSITSDSSSTIMIDTSRPEHTKAIGTQYEPFSTTVCSELNIIFVEMIDEYGDSVLIHCGEEVGNPKPTDFNMLIDAGQSMDGNNSSGQIKTAIRKYTGGDLDVVLFTHGHADHIGGMVNLFTDVDYDVDMFIDYGYLYKGSGDDEIQTSVKYRAKRDELIAQGTNYCTATESLNNSGVCSSTYYLAPDFTFEILDTGEYISDPETLIGNSQCNNTSIAGLFKYKNFSFLTTGDLDREEVLSRSEKLPNNVTLFKAGHHGSYTSNSAALLSKINPSNVVISAASLSNSGTENISHPSTTALKRIYEVVDKNHVYTNITMGNVICSVDMNNTSKLNVTGTGALKLRNPTEGDYPLIREEKDLPLVETTFYNFVIINYRGTPSTMADAVGVYPDAQN